MKPSKHISTVRQDCVILMYALVQGYELDIGNIIIESILEYEDGDFSGIIPHPFLITHLCIKGGVKVKSDEEKCPKTPPLTLTRALKALVESEYGGRREQIRKRKRVEAKTKPRGQAPNVVFDEGDNREERGMPEADTEQLELSLSIDHRELAPARAKKEGNRGWKMKKAAMLHL